MVSFAIIASSICCVSSRRRSRSPGQMRNQATAPSPSSEPLLTAYNTRIHQHTAITSPTGTTLAPSPRAPSQPPAFLRSTSVPIHNRSPLPRRTAFNRSPLQPRLETRSPSPQPINPRSPLPRLRGTITSTSEATRIEVPVRSPLPRLRRTVQHDEAQPSEAPVEPAPTAEHKSTPPYTRSVSPAPSDRNLPHL